MALRVEFSQRSWLPLSPCKHTAPTLLHPQGTYVLQDNSFPLLVRMASGLQYVEEAPKVWGGWSTPTLYFPYFSSPHPQGGLAPGQGVSPPRNPKPVLAPVLGVGLHFPTVTCAPHLQFLAFTCGLLRGTLSTLGIKSLVTTSVAALPACES